jgi:hypothetical protein
VADIKLHGPIQPWIPPHVPNAPPRFHEEMLFEEHGIDVGHCIVGCSASQSWASPCAHADWHAATELPFCLPTQHTRPAGQSAPLAHAKRAVPSGQVPDVQLPERLCVRQQICCPVVHDADPHAKEATDVSAGVLPSTAFESLSPASPASDEAPPSPAAGL